MDSIDLGLLKSFGVLLIISVLLFSGCNAIGNYHTVNNGVKTGLIVKLADEGLLHKTHEGQLIRGGLNSGSGVIGQPFNFTILDPKILAVAQQALDQQKEVEIHYHSEFFDPLSSGNESNNFVDDIIVK